MPIPSFVSDIVAPVRPSVSRNLSLARPRALARSLGTRPRQSRESSEAEWIGITPSDRAHYPEAQTEHASPCHHCWCSFTRQDAACQPLIGHALRGGCSLDSVYVRHSAKDVSSVGGTHTTLPAADTARADRRGHGAGADTLVSKSPAAQSQVSPHTATVWAAAHTQHSPLPSAQLPVSDCTAHGAASLATSDAAPQLQVSPHMATVGICATWRYTSGWSCPSSPPRASYARAGTASTRISHGSVHGIFRCCLCLIPSSHVSSDTHHSLEHFPCHAVPGPAYSPHGGLQQARRGRRRVRRGRRPRPLHETVSTIFGR
jgi:hypothetical protein